MQLAEFGHIQAGAESMDSAAHDKAIVGLDHAPIEVFFVHSSIWPMADGMCALPGAAWRDLPSSVRLLELWCCVVAVLGTWSPTIHWQPMVVVLVIWCHEHLLTSWSVGADHS
jgi:hypothetical protein